MEVKLNKEHKEVQPSGFAEAAPYIVDEFPGIKQVVDEVELLEDNSQLILADFSDVVLSDDVQVLLKQHM